MASSSDMYTPHEVTIRSGRVRMDGYLGLPLSPLGGVVFAHGSGRPGLAEAHLPSVTAAPTMLIVGGDDEPVIEMNRTAYRPLTCPKRLVIVPGARISSKNPAHVNRSQSIRSSGFSNTLILPCTRILMPKQRSASDENIARG